MKKNIIFLCFLCIIAIMMSSCSKDDLIVNKKTDEPQKELPKDVFVLNLTPKHRVLLKAPKYKADPQYSKTRGIAPTFVNVDENGMMTITTIESEEETHKSDTRLEIPTELINFELEVFKKEPEVSENYFRKLISLKVTRTEPNIYKIDDKDKLIKILDKIKDYNYYDSYDDFIEDLMFVLHTPSVKITMHSEDGLKAQDEDDNEVTVYNIIGVNAKAGTAPYICMFNGSKLNIENEKGTVLEIKPLDLRIKSNYSSAAPIGETSGFFIAKNAIIEQNYNIPITSIPEFSSSSEKLLSSSKGESKKNNIKSALVTLPKSKEAEYYNGNYFLDHYNSKSITNAKNQYLYVNAQDNLDFRFYIKEGIWWNQNLAGKNIKSIPENTVLKGGSQYIINTCVIPPLKMLYHVENGKVAPASYYFGMVYNEKDSLAINMPIKEVLTDKKKWAEGDNYNKVHNKDNTYYFTDANSLEQALNADQKVKIEKNIPKDLPALSEISKNMAFKNSRTYKIEDDYAQLFLPSIKNWNDFIVNKAGGQNLKYNEGTKEYVYLIFYLSTFTNTAVYSTIFNPIRANKEIRDLSVLQDFMVDNRWYWTSTEVADDATLSTASKALAIKFSLSEGKVYVEAKDKREECYIIPFLKYNFKNGISFAGKAQ